jgi:uncharacterized protein with HEPN domain
MKHPERVEDYLEHIAEAIDRATGYLQPLPDLEAFQMNPQVQDAVVRNIEIIGEAVNKITSTAPDFIKQHPDIPWARMRGMRNNQCGFNAERVAAELPQRGTPTGAAPLPAASTADDSGFLQTALSKTPDSRQLPESAVGPFPIEC